MRIIFVGTVQFSLDMLETILDEKAEVVGVISDPDSKRNADYADLRPVCERFGIDLYLTKDINARETLDWAKGLAPDVVFCFGWSRLIKSEFLSLPAMGVVGYHPSALPKNRGRHPLIWAIALGLEETASTFFMMDEGADTGDILSQSPVSIEASDDAASLYAKATDMAKAQLRELLPKLASGEFEALPQDHRLSNEWRKRSMRDGEIDWRMSSHSIHNLIRALARPYPGACAVIDEQCIKIWKSSVLDIDGVDNLEPGKVLHQTATGGYVVKCGEGCIELQEMEPGIDLQVGRYL